MIHGHPYTALPTLMTYFVIEVLTPSLRCPYSRGPNSLLEAVASLAHLSFYHIPRDNKLTCMSPLSILDFHFASCGKHLHGTLYHLGLRGPESVSLIEQEFTLKVLSSASSNPWPWQDRGDFVFLIHEPWPLGCS